MLKTRPTLYEVVGGQNNHLWLEVLEGNDAGIRISVPRRSSDYDEELQEEILELTTGEVHTFELESEAKASPNWRIASIDPDPDRHQQDTVTA